MAAAPTLRLWEPEFIRVWQAGVSQAEIAIALASPWAREVPRPHTAAGQDPATSTGQGLPSAPAVRPGRGDPAHSGRRRCCALSSAYGA
jgi:hypothetical protein